MVLFGTDGTGYCIVLLGSVHIVLLGSVHIVLLVSVHTVYIHTYQSSHQLSLCSGTYQCSKSLLDELDSSRLPGTPLCETTSVLTCGGYI